MRVWSSEAWPPVSLARVAAMPRRLLEATDQAVADQVVAALAALDQAPSRGTGGCRAWACIALHCIACPGRSRASHPCTQAVAGHLLRPADAGQQQQLLAQA
jgi:hypothetical protein